MQNQTRLSSLVLIPVFLIAISPLASGQTILSVEPSYGQPGAEIAITITCDFEHPLAEPITITFSPGSNITHGYVTLTDTDTLRTILYIPDETGCGVQDITIESAMWTYNGDNMFEVCGSAGDPRIVSVSPNSAYAGDSISVSIVGADTHFEEGVSTVRFSNQDVTVSNVAVTDPVVLTAQLDISASAMPGAQDVTVTTSQEIASGTALFSIEAPLVTVTPSSGQQGSTLPAVTISGGPGTFTPSTGVDLGEGISIGAVASPDGQTLALTDVAIADDAPVGPHDLTLTSPNLPAPGVFIVIQGPDTQVVSITPASGDRGHPGLNVSLVGQNTHFDDSDVTVFLAADHTSGSAPNAADATHLDATLLIGDQAPEGPTDVTVSLGLDSGCTSCEAATLVAGFEITSPGTLVAINPADLIAGTTTDVTVTATDGQFAAGQTTLVLMPPDDITIGAVNVTDSDHLTTSLEIAAGASGEPRDLRAVTGPEVAVGFDLVDVFSPEIASVVPSSGFRGTTIPVTITGQDVVFDASTTVTFSGTGVSVANLTVEPEEPAVIKMSLTIAEDAATTARDVTVSLGGGSELTKETAFQVSTLSTGDDKGGCSCAADTHRAPGLFLCLIGLTFLCGRRRRGGRR